MNHEAVNHGPVRTPRGVVTGRAELFVCRVKLSDGVAGSNTQPCTYRYLVYPVTDTAAAGAPLQLVPLLPAKARPALGRFVQAATGSLGLAAYILVGGVPTLTLLEAYGEVEDVGLCSGT